MKLPSDWLAEENGGKESTSQPKGTIGRKARAY
jgi:hypothetical protein